MQRLVKYLKASFSVISPSQLPATASEMTLHDALRICAGRMHENKTSAPVGGASHPIRVCWYRSESDLHDIWRCFDTPPHQTGQLSAVLVLGGFLRGNLRNLIRRQCLADRLVVVPCPGHWPGIDSFGDLVSDHRSLGWNSIELCRDVQVTMGTLESLVGHDGQLIVVLPAHTHRVHSLNSQWLKYRER